MQSKQNIPKLPTQASAKAQAAVSKAMPMKRMTPPANAKLKTRMPMKKVARRRYA